MKSTSYYYEKWLSRGLSLFLTILLCAFTTNGIAQETPLKKGPAKQSAQIYNSLPSGYSRVGNTRLYYKYTTNGAAGATNLNSIDILGYYGGKYYSSTYNDAGYRIAMKVGNNSAVNVNSKTGTTANGVTLTAKVEAQTELARMVYTLKNNNSRDVTVSVGVHADVMIGDNDHAPIERRIDREGNTYGLTMKNGNGAQLCVLFGSGLTGVTSSNDFWFGHYLNNITATAMVGNYSNTKGNYMSENGSYDSGMGWYWKDRLIPAGETIQLSWIIGVGQVNLEPNTDFTVTPTDMNIWNDITKPHTFDVEGYFESPFGQNGYIEYSAEDNEGWTVINSNPIPSGTNFTERFTLTFDTNRCIHEIRFRTRDYVGNFTLLPSVQYIDVSCHPVTGFKDYTYTGSAITQSNLTYDMDDDKWTTYYRNNVNAGTASFTTEGLYPYSIGKVVYPFTINPAPLTGRLIIADGPYVYNGREHQPSWRFSVNALNSLQAGRDYKVEWKNNIRPGTATLTVTGIGNYTGTLTGTFTIDKARITPDMYQVTLPDADITYDGRVHGATVTTIEGIGTATIKYKKQGENSFFEAAPSQPGTYDVYIEIAENDCYYGLEPTKVGTFTIYAFSEDEWGALIAIHDQLIDQGWLHPWDMSGGITTVGTLDGVTIEKGHVVGIELNGENISGTFPEEISRFPYLRHLDIGDNHLLCLYLGDVTSLTSANVHTQTATLPFVSTDDNTYSFNVPDDFDVTKVSSFKVNGTTVATPTVSDGVLTFKYTGDPITVTYYYNTSNAVAGLMDVRINVGSINDERPGYGILVDEYYFPDPIFRQWVLDNVDGDGNGILTQGEIDAITVIDVHGMGIHDLTGIEYFTGLLKLYAYDNYLTFLNLGGNGSLGTLYIYGNQLLEIDLSGNSSLSDAILSPQRLHRFGYDDKNGYWSIKLIDGFNLSNMGNLNVNGRTINVGDTYFTADGYWHFPFSDIPTSMTFDYATGFGGGSGSGSGSGSGAGGGAGTMQVIIDIEPDVSEDGGFVDGINNATSLEDDAPYYDLQGRRYDNKPIYHGIYMHNGKKVFVK